MQLRVHSNEDPKQSVKHIKFFLFVKHQRHSGVNQEKNQKNFFKSSAFFENFLSAVIKGAVGCDRFFSNAFRV